MTLRRLVKRYLRKRSGLSKQILNSSIIAAKINDSGIFIDWRVVLNKRGARRDKLRAALFENRWFSRARRCA
jgi:hypothetical protein